MLRDGTICPINSPYASPVVLTRKKNDLPPDSPEAYRFAIDYRKLKGITKYPRYPLPVIDDLLTNIPHTNVMSTLDLRSGYFQLAISPRDIEKQRLSLAMALLHSYACLLVFLGRHLISNGQLILFSNLLLGVSCWCIWTMLL
ncbi:transposon Ty3-I Gag-Pol polyprotein [Trichonephila clavipes]|nr:transposon Ty3-I Gag-Pol polyprotein [Trichonephila clavipes]